MRTSVIATFCALMLAHCPMTWALDLTCSGAPELSATQQQRTLAELQKRYAAVKSLRASFRQESFVAALDEVERSEGKVWFLTPAKMKWHYKSPNEQVFLLKEDTVYYYQAEERQLLVEELRGGMLSELPVSFLLGVGDIEKSFDLFGGCSTANGLLLGLKPKSGSEPNLQELWLLVDDDTFLPEGAKTVDLGGNATSIVFSQTERDVVIAESTFAADFPTGIDVQDRRQLREKDVS
ncbi:MAG: outer membrane lipoprotein carrier protein LolA [Bdellovibrionota bacterium]|nr:MAG: outer membrane lipoprotein carrier protein LolA [Bdellovibrionota bacterium]